MLEAEDFDEDYFTPVASASLANIFGKTSVSDERTENESLKYTPPKSQNVNQQLEDCKATSCIFACALIAYEWHNNVYSLKGRLGFAILKILTSSHNIILYDMNKTTLSNTTVSEKLTVTVKSNNYVSYYDDQRKYWSLYGAENEIQKVKNILKTLQVTILESTETDLTPPVPTQNGKQELKSIQIDNMTHLGTDTDSSTYRKTKASILNRMANMGHSVLPSSAVNTGVTSDSSDTNDTDTHINIVRHKPVKAIFKKSNINKTIINHHKDDVHCANTENSTIACSSFSEILNLNSFPSDQLLPLATSTAVTSTENNINLLITEQRIGNSELRINMGRISDKVDDMISKINSLQIKDQNEGAANMNIEILNKLLKQYEHKISVYEDLFRQMGTDTKIPLLSDVIPQHNNEELMLKNRIEKLESAIKEKNETVISLQNETEKLGKIKESYDKILHDNKSLLKKMSDLETELLRNQDAIIELTEENDKLRNTKNNSDIENKIKSVMNETYQAIATNFENDVSYNGDTIKKTIATVIKRVTISALNEDKIISI